MWLSRFSMSITRALVCRWSFSVWVGWGGVSGRLGRRNPERAANGLLRSRWHAGNLIYTFADPRIGPDDLASGLESMLGCARNLLNEQSRSIFDWHGLVLFCLFWSLFGIVMLLGASTQGVDPNSFDVLLFVIIWGSVFVASALGGFTNFKRALMPQANPTAREKKPPRRLTDSNRLKQRRKWNRPTRSWHAFYRSQESLSSRAG